MYKKSRLSLGGNSVGSSNLSFGFNAASASFHALAVYPGPLQIRQQAADRSAHAVRAFNSAGIGFAADSTHSGHKSWNWLN